MWTGEAGEYSPPQLEDPWKANRYHFYPGPWTSDDPIPFRILDVDTDIPGSPKPDGHEVRMINELGEEVEPPEIVGLPAPRDQIVYIYSFGANLESNQLFDEGYDPSNVDLGADFVGGGDDINNWSRSMSWLRWYPIK